MVVGERYRLDRELGVGGTAAVWLAHDLFTDTPCAVKWLLPDPRGGPTRRERMRGEVKALVSLEHPHVIRVTDVGAHEDRDYLVMELLERGSLADLVERDGPLPPAEAVRLSIQVLSALGAAHQAGVVHRDVKPGNVLLRDDGTAVLCDFGIARADGVGGETRTGMALGSVGFMAPEQRVDARKVGPAADLYAAACTLFNVITGDTPIDLYLAPDHSPRWEGVPAPLAPILRRATRVSADQRYVSAEEMAEALTEVLPSLERLPAVRRTRLDPTPSHVPTRVDEPLSLDAERPRTVDAHDWGWSSSRSTTGRPALWVGTALLAVVTAVGSWIGPLAASEEPPAPAPVAVAAPTLGGTWVGTLGPSTRAELVLRGPSDRMAGDLVVHVGSNEVRSRLVGAWDPTANELRLKDDNPAAPGVWTARPSASGLVLEGELVRAAPARALRFAFVRLE
jgi:serine/threonine-protein kinase